MKKPISASATIMPFTGVACGADPPDWMTQATPPQLLSNAYQEYQAIFSAGALPNEESNEMTVPVRA